MAKLRRSGPELLDKRLMRIEVDRTIEASADAIWKLISDHRTRSSWYPANDEFTPVGSDVQGVGATFLEREWLWKATVEIVEWDSGQRIGFATRSLNLPGLLRQLYTEFSLEPVNETRTIVHIRGAFRFGPLGWVLCAYTYPQMIGTLWFDYRSSLKTLGTMLSRPSPPR